MGVRKAVTQDVDKIYEIAQNNTEEIGYIPKPAYEEGVEDGDTIVAVFEDEVVGFAKFHEKKNGITTLNEIVVSEKVRGEGLGKEMLDYLERKGHYIQLKVPVDNDSVEFYEHIGYNKIKKIEKEEKRDLFVFRSF